MNGVGQGTLCVNGVGQGTHCVNGVRRGKLCVNGDFFSFYTQLQNDSPEPGHPQPLMTGVNKRTYR